jgi:hypothetical protein
VFFVAVRGLFERRPAAQRAGDTAHPIGTA